MDDTLIPLPRPIVRVRNYGGRIILSVGENTVELSESAEMMWRSLAPDRDVRKLVELVVDAYDAPVDEVSSDVREWIAEMAASGFIELRAATDRPTP